MEQFHGVMAQLVAPAFWLGALVGAFSTLAKNLLISLFSRIAENLPSLFDRTSSVRGDWDTKFARLGPDLSESEHASVYQFRHWVWGTVLYKRRLYKFRGTFRERVLVATYEPQNERRALDRGAFTLHLLMSGDEMKGCYAWTDATSSAPTANKYEWQRVKK